MQLSECIEEGIHILSPKGEIDMAYSPVLRSLLVAKEKVRCPALILDLSEVQFIGSTGLAVIIEYFRDAGSYNGVFCIAGLQEPVRTVFEIVRLHKALPIFANRAEAIEVIQRKNLPCTGALLFDSPIKHEFARSAQSGGC